MRLSKRRVLLRSTKNQEEGQGLLWHHPLRKVCNNGSTREQKGMRGWISWTRIAKTKKMQLQRHVYPWLPTVLLHSLLRTKFTLADTSWRTVYSYSLTQLSCSSKWSNIYGVREANITQCVVFSVWKSLSSSSSCSKSMFLGITKTMVRRRCSSSSKNEQTFSFACRRSSSLCVEIVFSRTSSLPVPSKVYQDILLCKFFSSSYTVLVESLPFCVVLYPFFLYHKSFIQAMFFVIVCCRFLFLLSPQEYDEEK